METKSGSAFSFFFICSLIDKANVLEVSIMSFSNLVFEVVEALRFFSSDLRIFNQFCSSRILVLRSCFFFERSTKIVSNCLLSSWALLTLFLFFSSLRIPLWVFEFACVIIPLAVLFLYFNLYALFNKFENFSISSFRSLSSWSSSKSCHCPNCRINLFSIAKYLQI